MSDQTENITLLAYCKFAEQYSKHNWFSNMPLFDQLSDDDKNFWRLLIRGILVGFRNPKLPDDDKGEKGDKDEKIDKSENGTKSGTCRRSLSQRAI